MCLFSRAILPYNFQLLFLLNSSPLPQAFTWAGDEACREDLFTRNKLLSPGLLKHKPQAAVMQVYYGPEATPPSFCSTITNWTYPVPLWNIFTSHGTNTLLIWTECFQNTAGLGPAGL